MPKSWVQLRVEPETRDRLRTLAAAAGMTMVEALEILTHADAELLQACDVRRAEARATRWARPAA